MKIYGDGRSGNCYKLKLAAALLGIDHEWVPVDVMGGATRTPEFLAMNPNGKVPVVELDDGSYLAESNAILYYLAAGSALLPRRSYDQAKVLEWMFFEQYSHEPCIAVRRFIRKYQGMPEQRRAEYEAKEEGGYRALGVMEKRLAAADYLVGESISIADISLYGYTHVADEGGFSLREYPGIRRWIGRIRGLPRYVGMEQ